MHFTIVVEVVDDDLIGFMAPTTVSSIDSSPIARLRKVDALAGSREWATVEEGCNGYCRGGAWANNAENTPVKLGFFPAWIRRKMGPCSGIGGQLGSETIGKTCFPCRIVGSRPAVSGSFESKQLKNQDHVPFPPPPNARGKLGLGEDLANGTASLEHEVNVELRRCAR